MKKGPADLPSLVHDFRHAQIRRVSVGPRREVTLVVSPLVWEGHLGRFARSCSIRFGGIENFAEVSAFFAADLHDWSELAWLRYDESCQSRAGCLFFELRFERIDARLAFRCSHLQVDALGEPICGESGTALRIRSHERFS